MQGVLVLCNVVRITYCQLLCSRLIIAGMTFELHLITHCQVLLTVALILGPELTTALW